MQTLPSYTGCTVSQNAEELNGMGHYSHRDILLGLCLAKAFDRLNYCSHRNLVWCLFLAEALNRLRVGNPLNRPFVSLFSSRPCVV